MTRSCTVPDWLVLCIALPLTPIWLPIICLRKGYRCVNKRGDSPENQEIQRRNATRPPQLPYSRRFSPSTATLPPTHNPSSPLLRLPYSIRRQIYAYLFDNRYVIHIGQQTRRLAHCHTLYPEDWPANQHIRNSTLLIQPFGEPPRSTHLDLELLRTCRTVYQEAHPIVYQTNTFSIRHLDNLIYFNQGVRYQHLAMIKYVQIDWDMPFVPMTSHHGFRRPYDAATWTRFWNIVATRLVGLVSLDLTVRVWLWDMAQEYKWLKDVAKVRRLKEFILDIKYPAGEDGEDVSETTKRVRREVERMVMKGWCKQRWRSRSFDGREEEEGEGEPEKKVGAKDRVVDEFVDEALKYIREP